MVVIDVMVVIDDINVYSNCITNEDYSNIILGFDDLILKITILRSLAKVEFLCLG